MRRSKLLTWSQRKVKWIWPPLEALTILKKTQPIKTLEFVSLKSKSAFLKCSLFFKQQRQFSVVGERDTRNKLKSNNTHPKMYFCTHLALKEINETRLVARSLPEQLFFTLPPSSSCLNSEVHPETQLRFHDTSLLAWYATHEFCEDIKNLFMF